MHPSRDCSKWVVDGWLILRVHDGTGLKVCLPTLFHASVWLMLRVHDGTGLKVCLRTIAACV